MFDAPFPLAAQTLNLGGLALKNRVVFGAHATGLANDGIDDRLIGYHEARARGGTALIVVEAAAVLPEVASSFVLRGRSDLAGWARMAHRLHHHETKVFQQLFHPGSLRPMRDGSPAWSPSGVPAPDGRVPLEMTLRMIDDLVEAFARAAAQCAEAGFDGVEVQLGHGFLLGQFLSPVTNRRVDEFGGDAQRRSTVVRRTLNAVREVVPRDFIVGARFSVSEGVSGGIAPLDCARIVRSLERYLDYAGLSMGSYYQPDLIAGPMHLPGGYQLGAALPVAAQLAVPTVVGGKVGTMRHVEAILTDSPVDLVSVVRAQVADPRFVQKSLAGRSADVRPCIYCNQGCVGGRLNEGRLSCTVNPEAVGTLFARTRADKSGLTKRIAVVGGGPAGLEAARAAATAGNEVTLFEADSQLGGKLTAARNAPWREPIGAIADYLAGQVEALGVQVHLRTRLTIDDIVGLDHSRVVIATGGVFNPLLVNIRGGTGSIPVASPEAVLLDGGPADSGVVVIVDRLGDGVAVGVAEYLLQRGHSVTHLSPFVTPAPGYAATLELDAAVDRVGSESGYRFIGECLSTSRQSDTVVATDAAGRRWEARPDLVVAVVPRLPSKGYAGLGARFVVAGDAGAPASLEEAIFSGRRCGLLPFKR